jgi:serine/threonine protein kinase
MRMPQGTLQLHTYFGPYLLQKLIAIGGMAEIYLARTKGLAGFERQLALKVVHPDYADDKAFIQMLINEAKIAVGLNHRNVVQTFDLGRIGNRYFISMEYVDGMDLFQLLKRLTELGSSMPVELAAYAVQGALSGLDYAHNKCDEQGKPLRIIHRDMSPQNILCSRQGEVKITDFGIAKAANLTGKTRAGVIKGKLVYMSPEQAWGEPVDHRTDLFSVGIVLYEALTGGSLYPEKNPAKLLDMVRRAEIRPPSHRRREVPPELDALVMRSLALRPEDRFQSAREFGAALADFLHRNAPGVTDRQLGELVERTLAGHPAADDLSVSVMARDDFAVHEHSIIFSADEMRASRPPLPAAPPSPPAPQESPASASHGADAQRARLLLLEDAEARPLDIDKQFIIGRSGDLRLGDARVSRRHARIYLDGEYHLEDLGSANGTFLNEEKIQRPTRLRDGDIIRVGPFEMRFLLEDAPAPGAPPPPGGWGAGAAGGRGRGAPPPR